MPKQDTYFLIHSGESNITVEALTADQVLNRITPDEDDDTYYGPDPVFCASVPNCDGGYFTGTADNMILLIRGEIVVPKVVKVATRYQLTDGER